MSIFKNPKVKTYPSSANEVKFLLGGIGTGNVSIGSRGQITDFEIFNEPSKGRTMPYTFFSIWSKADGEKADARILEARLNPPYERALGYFSNELAGMPRFEKGEIAGAYPFVRVNLRDKNLPLNVSLTAFTPFIPLNADDSGIPGAYMEYTVENTGDKEREVSICGSFANPSAFNGYDLFRNMQHSYPVRNEYCEAAGMKGIRFLPCDEMPKEERYYGNMAFFSPEENVTVRPEWYNGAWWDCAHEFWDDFSEDGKLEREAGKIGETSQFNNTFRVRIGSVCATKTLQPGEKKTFRFILSWYFPNHANRWEGHLLPYTEKKEKSVKVYYAYRFKDAVDVAVYLANERERLTSQSLLFTKAMYNSTVDKEVIDAVMATMTVLRSPTCYRIREEGIFLGWEGCFPHMGSCEGNCTHVWNYAQTVAFLFPQLEQCMRRIEFLQETDEQGNMSFRCNSVYDNPRWDMIPATDGQLGCIIRLYRDWKFSGNDALLNEVWSQAVKTLDFAFDYWDSDGDCVLDSQQHNTYDIEFYGLTSLTNSIFFAALKAGSEMAEYVGDIKHAEKWRDALEKGAARMDAELWNGEYYEQKIDDVNKYKYQYGTGCLSDQLLGQSLAHVSGLGYVLPEAHVKEAVRSVYKYNFREEMSEMQSVQRCYALNDDSGLLLCSWPRGNRPKIPFVYADEVWSGIEYQVAAHLVYEGYIEEGLHIVKGVRARHDGVKRNPFNEVECGNHYVRSMASYAVYLALIGFEFDMTKNEVSFAPKQNAEDFSCFFSTGKGWGIYRTKTENGVKTEQVECLYGSMDGLTLGTQKTR